MTRELADIMADVLLACAPHSVDTVKKGKQRRAKLDFNVLNAARVKVRKLAESAGIDFKFKKSGYPHFYYVDDKPHLASPKGEGQTAVYELSGQRVRQVLDYAVSSDLSVLKKGKTQVTSIATPKGVVKGMLKNVDNTTYQLAVPVKNASAVATWLRDLSDGYTSFNLDGKKDFSAKRMPGAFVVTDCKADKRIASHADVEAVSGDKPFYIGI